MSLSLSLSLSLSVWNPLNHFSLQHSRFIGSVFSLLFTSPLIPFLQFRPGNKLLINTDFIFDWDLANNLDKAVILTKTFIFHFQNLFYITNTSLQEPKKGERELSCQQKAGWHFLVFDVDNVGRQECQLLPLSARPVKPPVFSENYWVSLFLMSGFSPDYWWWWWWWWWWYW